MKNNSNVINKLIFKTIDGIVYLDFSKIIRFEAESKYTLIYTLNNKNAIRSLFPISLIEVMLPTSFFFRTHRSHIINFQYLEKLEKNKNTLHLIDNHIVPISKNRLSKFIECTQKVL